jgi:hypothetical protein
VHIGDPCVINLCQESPYVFIGGSRVITREFGKVRHPEPSGIRYGIKILEIRTSRKMIYGDTEGFFTVPIDNSNRY